jgi:release factor glutamine methyltransferase
VDERQLTRGEYLLRLNAEDPDRPSEFELLGKRWVLLDGVFSPHYTVSTELLTSWMPYPEGGSFLEIGSGAGVTAVTAAQSGCASVTALDISAAAVENTRRNAELHGVADRVRVAHSDLFDALDAGERFDLIFWNSNYIEAHPDAVNETELHHALFDPGFEAHRRFLAEAPQHLTVGGRVLLGFSDIGSWAALRRLCRDAGCRVELLRWEQRQQNQPVEFQLLEIHGLGMTDASERETLRDALESSSDLADLRASIDDLVVHASLRALEAGDVLLSEGDEADALYIVLEGSVQVLVTGSDGRELVLARLGSGRVVGEQVALSARRQATVRAAEPVTLARIDRAAFAHDTSADGPIHRRLHEIAEGYASDRALRGSALGALLRPDPDATARTVAAGEVLFRQGDEADCVYLIASGTAAVYKERGERRELIGRVREGRCVGELALVRKARRSATVVAETELRLVAVDGRHFLDLLDSSPALRDHMQALERVYRLPARGVITQHTGQVEGEDAITTLYHLADGRRFVASRVVARDLYHLERVEPAATEPGRVTHGGIEIAFDDAGAIVSIAAAGDWPQLPAAHLLAIDAIALTREDRATFQRTGELAAPTQPDGCDPGAVLCGCVQVTSGAVDTAIRGGCATTADLQRELACGSVCGGCFPGLAERVAQASWTPVEVVSEIDLTESLRAFRLLPTAGRPRRWRPGQHIVVAADIDGHQVERRYSLSGTPNDPEYEITVKREQLGRFSNWLFDERLPGELLRVSEPRGEPAWELGDEPALCFVAGVGVAPLVAACRALGDDPPAAPIHVDLSVRRADGLDWLDEVRGRAGVTVAVRETAMQGRLTAADVRELVSLHPAARVYVCGPPGYLRDVSLYLRTAGVPTDRIHVEVFAHAGGPPPGASEPDRAPAGLLDGTSDYEIFIRTAELLALQVSPEDWVHPDELLFQVVHQVSELWLKLAVSELGRAADHLRAGETPAALRLLRRAIECMKLTTSALDMLEQMSPWEYHEVRRALGQGSGFDSPGFCGVRDVSPQLGVLFRHLREAAGVSLLEVYTRGRELEDLYQLAELLTEWDERCTMWRMRHVKVVKRILGGGASGTAGTPVEVLERLIDTSFYPDLWKVRNELTARSELEPKPLRPHERA